MEGPVAAHASRRNDGELVQDDVTGITGYGGEAQSGSACHRPTQERYAHQRLQVPCSRHDPKILPDPLIFHSANFR